MLFRYKITKSSDGIGSICVIRYNVKIQRYNQNNSVFKWETCENTTLKSIVELLSNKYCFSSFDNALPEIVETISKYGNVDVMIAEYIKKIIIRDMRLEDAMSNLEKSLDNLVLANDWNTIEIEENE